MKNTMKKRMSLVHVAVLLISAVPFQAKADTGITVYVGYDGGDKSVVGEANYVPSNKTDMSVTQYLDNNLGNWSATYEIVNKNGEAKIHSEKQGDISPDTRVAVGDTVYVNLKTKVTTPDPKPEAQPTKYYVNVIVKKDSVAQSPVQKEIQGATTTVGDLIDYKINQDLSGYYFDHAYVDGKGTLGRDGVVDAGDTVEFAFYSVEETVEPITVYIKGDTSNNVIAGPIYKEPANGEYALVKDLLNYCWNSDWDNVYTFDHAWSKTNNKTTSDSSAKIYAGDEVHIMLKTKTTTSTGSSSSSGSTTTNKFPYNVYLNIYKGTTVGTPAKTINITSGIALDGKVTLAEVKSLVLNYYTANTSAGITFDGLYLAKGNWVSNYVYDQKYDEFDDINTLRQIDTVYINVMIDNCTAKTTSTSTADSSNPKTGDSIFMPVAVLGISASALATAFFFANKKRLAK